MKQSSQDGFTMLELVAVLIVIGLVSLFLMSRQGDIDHDLVGQLSTVKSHLRFAQAKAMNTAANWYIHFQTSPSQYTLYDSTNTAQLFPGEKGVNVALDDNLILSAETYILFDYLGRPYTSISLTRLTTSKTILTSSAGNIDIKPETGFVPD